MTDHDLALVLPTDTDIELLGEDAQAARGYAATVQPGPFGQAYRLVGTVVFGVAWAGLKAVGQ